VRRACRLAFRKIFYSRRIEETMLNAVLLSAALLTGQVEAPSAAAQILPPLGAREITPATVTLTSAACGSACGTPCSTGCGTGCRPTACSGSCCSTGCRNDCHVEWLKPWTCDALKMEPFKAKCHTCGGLLYRLLYCPKDEEEKNGNGDAKNGDAKNGDKKDEKNGDKKDEKKNGNGNGEEEKPDTTTPLMQWIRCRNPDLFKRMECNNTKIYGWLQAGYTANFDSPRDRLNYGTNFNNRSNDFLLNQAYLVLERPLDLEKRKCEWHIGYRVDLTYGHDATYFENPLGPFNRFTGDRLEVSRLSENGVSIPQAYLDVHAPILTDRGVDFRFGRFFTHMTYELSPAPQTMFYSHSYEYFYAMPFTHLAATATVHIGDTLDVMGGITRGWDVALQDNNDVYSYIGSLTWNSCDKRRSLAIAWTFGPEQIDNNHDDRAVVTAYATQKFGCYNEWMVVGGGGVGWEQNATADPLSARRTSEWYSASGYLFYTVSPKLTLGTRAEWFHDDDGSRTGFANSDFGGATWNRPGYAGSFYDVTFGATYKPWQNLRLRPEIRFDWFNGQAIDGSASRPFNDQRDRFQTTLGMDVIWEF
jgi:hypothetical protein